MRFRYIWSVLAIVAVLGAPASAASSANLIKNGGFDAGPKPGYFATFAKGSTQIPGWVVTMGTVDVIGPTFHDADGGHYSIDLDGTPGPGGIAQSLPTRRGARYRVTFSLAGNPECPPALKLLMVTVGGVSRRYTFDASHTSDAHMGWQVKSFTFTAGGARSTLRFTSLDPKGSNCGPAIDAVSVVPGAAAAGRNGMVLSRTISGGGSGKGLPVNFKPCYKNAGAYAATGPCFGPAGTAIYVELLRPMPRPPAKLVFKAVLVSGVPAQIVAALSGGGNVYSLAAPLKLCAGPTFPHKWMIWLMDSAGAMRGEIGEFTMTGCP